MVKKIQTLLINNRDLIFAYESALKSGACWGINGPA